MRSGFLHEKKRDLEKADFQESQSLLNEVWFPTGTTGWMIMEGRFMSQSLLNEVWFPTDDGI